MENAAKGLMIAGAILIVIVLIGIGVALVSQAQGFMTSGTTQFSDMEKQTFNSPLEQYEGKRTGSDVKALISKVNSNNLTAAADETLGEKGIDIIFHQDIGAAKIEAYGQSSYSTTSATAARNKINTGKTYYIALGYSATGLINKIAIALTNVNDAAKLLSTTTTTTK